MKKINVSYNFNDESDYFDVLKLDKNTATESDIKKSYRALTLKLHPDKTGQFDSPLRNYANEKFKILTQAHEILSDELKRRYYKTYKKMGNSNEQILVWLRGL